MICQRGEFEIIWIACVEENLEQTGIVHIAESSEKRCTLVKRNMTVRTEDPIRQGKI